jgi:hypothetical protein
MKGIFDKIASDNVLNDEPAPVDETPGNQEAISADGTVLEKYTPADVKSAAQELLRYGIIESVRKPALYRTVQRQKTQINDVLEPLDLLLQLDEIRGIAFLKVAGQLFDDEDEWSHPLVRRQRLTLEQSLLVAILRQQFIAHEEDAGIGAQGASVHIEDLLPRLQDFLGDPGSDAKEQKRLRNLLEKLKAHGIVSQVDAKDRIIIKPIIAHMANPESLDTLLAHLKELALKQKISQPGADD